MENDAPAAFKIVPPSDTPEFMYGAYFSCLHWAIGEKGILDSFQEDTGVLFPRPRTRIEKMVDSATGFDQKKEFVRAFVPWFNEWVWGKMSGEEPDE
jgi:hypothetical protein